MIFSDMHMKVLANFVNQISNNIEFEIRLGKFIFNKETKTPKFESNVDVDFFYTMKNRLDNCNVECNYIETVEYIYSKKNLRKIVNKDGKIMYMTKQSCKKYDIYDYELRLSLASEKYIDVNEEIDDSEYDIMRKKKRYSYKMIGCGSLDLTIVDQNGEMRYEIELEVKEGDINNIMYIITDLLQNRQKNFYVITGLEKRNVLNEYKNLVNNYYFIGAQPETLHKDQITVLYKKMYSVTDKADGDRYLMLIDKNRNVYLIDNNLNNVLKTDIKSKSYYSTLLDGEVVRTQSSIIFLAFDMMVYNGKDIRGNNGYMLKKRLDILKDIVSSIGCNEKYVVEMKRYIYKNVFLGSKLLMEDEKYYGNDGLIFTPMDEPYPLVKKWSSLLKWKPSELNTIDLYSVKTLDNTWELYVQHNVQQDDNVVKKNKTEKVLFDVQKLCKNSNNLDKITFKTEFDNSYIDPTTREPFMSNTVIEYKWDMDRKCFVPLRTRWDKTVNPKKHGNYSQVACDIWNNIHNPITQELLLKFTIYNNNDDVFFERMRKYHNKIKEYLYNKYCNNKESLLELCSGKGGDLHKWIYNNITNVQGYDISDKNIMECKKRVQSIGDKMKNYNYDFYKLDLCNSISDEIIFKNNASKEFDVVCCQFGLHYFFSSEKSFENILSILDTCLMKDGYFIVTFMDDLKINNLFGDKDACYKSEDKEIIYYMEKHMNVGSEYGNKLKIVLNGNNILGEGSDEFIINYNNFCKKMSDKGYDCVDTELFENLYKSYENVDGYKLKECERDISFLNRYCVFKKIKKDVSIKNEISYINTKDVSYEIIDLHKDNLSVYKINTLYDVLDVLNCKEYTYYRNDYTNKMIENFQDISSCIKNVKFIQNPLDLSEYNVDNCLYITFYKHTIEKKVKDDENTETEIIEYNNWYIVFHKNQMFFTIQKNKDVETLQKDDIETKLTKLSLKEDEEEDKKEDEEEDKKEDEKDEIKSVLNNKKVTIVVLKNYLKKYNLKTSGNKDELINRLRNYMM